MLSKLTRLKFCFLPTKLSGKGYLFVSSGLSAGEMTVTFLGNQEYRHYVELGPAITAVNAAENFCQSGMIVMSPDMFQYCTVEMFQTDTLEDGLHRRVN